MAFNKSIVSADWLNSNLSAPNIKILDASWYLPVVDRDPKEEYKSGHIPGAFFFDIDVICDLSSDFPHMLPSSEKFASCIKDFGIGDCHRVIVYDGSGMFSAARVYWMFKVFGFEDVAVLNGGFPIWKDSGYQVTTTVRPVQMHNFTVRKNSTMVADSNEVKEACISRAAQVLDARAPDRFWGKVSEPRHGLRSGHIPNSLNIPFQSVLNKDGTFKTVAELSDVFGDAGVNLKKPIITSCGSGVTAAILNLALEQLDAKKVSLYDGSWCEWGSSEKFKIQT